MIGFWIQKSRRHWLQITAGWVAVSFLFTTVSAPFVQANLWEERKQAVKMLQKEQAPLLARLPALEPHSTRNVENLQSYLESQPSLSSVLRPRTTILKTHTNLPRWNTSLPLNYATLKKASVPPTWKAGDPFVIYIQDAHLNKDAQTNIGKSIQHTIDHGNVDLVALEGAFAPIDISRFRKFPNQEAVHKVADYLLRENKISGAIHTAFTSPKEIPAFVGVDDKHHYDANVLAYKQSFPKVTFYKEELAKREKELDLEKRNLFNPELSALDKGVQSYRSENENLGSYIQLLSKYQAYNSEPIFDRHSRSPVRHSGVSRNPAGGKSVPDSRLPDNVKSLESGNPEVNKFLKALKMETSLDFSRVEKERASLLDKLAKNLSKEGMTELLNSSLAYRLGTVQHTDFYVYLKDLCQKNGVDFKKFPQLDSYIQYALLSDKINAEKLFDEVKEMEEKAYNSLTKTQDEKRLVYQSKYLYLLSKLIVSSLTREEWKEYETISDGHDTVASQFDLKSFEEFYKESLIRDEKISSNLLKTIKEKEAKTAVLVTGGFHSDG
ncbi:MAG: hypothetical protein HYY63_05690, partial [Elusimicrobia bacterium]|nr:hypothetical protein [Elusimicrobiota bacterium]